MSLYTRKHYEPLARVLALAYHHHRGSHVAADAIAWLHETLAHELRADSPAFNAEKFTRQIGGLLYELDCDSRLKRNHA